MYSVIQLSSFSLRIAENSSLILFLNLLSFFIFFLHLELLSVPFIPQLQVVTILYLEQLLMLSLFYDLALLQNNYDVAVLNS
mgnify:CR=1 FL=1